MLIIETERLQLRTVSPDDAPFYLELVNEPSWLQHIGDKHVYTVEAARVAIAEGPCDMQRRLGHSLYLVERKDDGAPLGLCGLIKRDSLPGVDIGYALRPAYWGQGYAYEAAAAVLAYGRDTLRLPRLLAITGPDNAASNGLLRKLGLQFQYYAELPPSGLPTNVYQLDFSAPG
ncbi:MAG TPA: GNAT family N-acetyltransferase [Burkholderiaceae bacterium]|nr:GNAT family N-acetyltransferase [Burkholderiaceae bacterium]